MRYILILLLCAGAIGPALAQKHDYNWVTGLEHNYQDPFGNMRMDFNFTPPQIIKENLGMNFKIAQSAFSDSSGSLLFYTNGIKIFNKDKKLMEGGDSINYGDIWVKMQDLGYLSFFTHPLPVPNQMGLHYLFHIQLEFNETKDKIFQKNLYYTIIDTKSNNGLGKVLSKNNVLMTGDIMWPAVVKHGNGRDWWIMGMQRADTKHYLYLLSPQGLSGPYIQDIGPPFVPTEFGSESIFSEDGRYFLRHDAKTGPRLYDFDRCTGRLSNLRIIPYKPGAWSSFYAAFSPNNRFLYLSRPGGGWSLDLTAEDLSESYDSLAIWEINYFPTWPWSTGHGLNQLAPDGKIYSSSNGASRAFNVIHRPDLPGDATDWEEAGVVLPRFTDGGICQYPNYRLSEWQGSPCDTLNGGYAGDGFTHIPYQPGTVRRDGGEYVVLPPLGGLSCPDCTERELETLNNPMAWIYAQLHLAQTGRLPDDWPREKAERAGMVVEGPLNAEKLKTTADHE